MASSCPYAKGSGHVGESQVYQTCATQIPSCNGGAFTSTPFRQLFRLLFPVSVAQSRWSLGLGLTLKHGLCETTHSSELLDCSLQWMVMWVLYTWFVCYSDEFNLNFDMGELLPGYASFHHQIHQTPLKILLLQNGNLHENHNLYKLRYWEPNLSV